MAEDARLFGRSKEAHGRTVKDMMDVSLVRKWLRLCQEEHDDVCQGSWWIDRREALPSAVRMIDVKTMSLVPAPKRCRYIALSYVWGGVGSQYQTMLDNVSSRSVPGGLDISILPATIVDSIHVCKLLGERYLWIDALCIIQDSHEDKAAQIGVMHQIYGCSYLTLFAVAGLSAHAGLPGVRPGSRKVKQHIEKVQGLHFAVPLPNLLHTLSRSAWGSRGWTYQEAMLSCRRLFFTEDQIYFECLEEVWPEDIISEHRRSPQSFHSSRFTGIGSLTFPRAPTQSWLQTSYTDTYMSIVNNYGPRDFTSELDAVDGMSAITTALTNAFQLGPYGFRYGMLLKDLDRTLLWVPSDSVQLVRRNIPKDAPWPSWSWIGWRGATEYTIKWTQCGSTYPKVLTSLIDSFSLYEHGVLAKLDSKYQSEAIYEGEGLLPKYHPPKSDSVRLPEGLSIPEGTLVFRTTAASLHVGDHDASRSPKISNACNGTFVLHLKEGSPAAGRICLPCLNVSSTQPAYPNLELIATSRSSGEIGLCDEEVYGDRGRYLLVLAVVPKQNAMIYERVGSGIVAESAWLESGAQEKLVFLA
ncbi:hypothetical protein ONZ45_g6205 [Pleurotus djamor]|nr:hypothetical protein ONZ45_g6205 [Pleurotus djamor]